MKAASTITWAFGALLGSSFSPFPSPSGVAAPPFSLAVAAATAGLTSLTALGAA